MKSIDNGDGATMTPLEVAQDIIANRDDDRCALNNLYSQKLARHIVELHERYRWIPVEERRPGHCGWVMARTRSGSVIIANLYGSDWYDHEDLDRDVTHWREIDYPEEADPCKS